MSSILGFGGLPTAIDPTIQSRIISQLPTTSNSAGGDGLNTAGYSFNSRADTDRPTYTTRVDVDINDKNSVYGVFSYNKGNLSAAGRRRYQFHTASRESISSRRTRHFAVAYRHVFSSNIFNEARFGNYRSYVPFFRTVGTPQLLYVRPARQQSRKLSQPRRPAPFGTAPFLDQGRRINNYTYADNVDWVAGRHTFRFGGQIQQFAVDSYNAANIVPNYTISTGPNTPQFAAANFPGGINNTQLGTANNLLAIARRHH